MIIAALYQQTSKPVGCHTEFKKNILPGLIGLSLNFLCLYFFRVCKIITSTNQKQTKDKSYLRTFDIDKEVDRIILFFKHHLCSNKLRNTYLDIISRCKFRIILQTKGTFLYS